MTVLVHGGCDLPGPGEVATRARFAQLSQIRFGKFCAPRHRGDERQARKIDKNRFLDILRSVCDLPGPGEVAKSAPLGHASCDPPEGGEGAKTGSESAICVTVVKTPLLATGPGGGRSQKHGPKVQSV